MAAKKKAASDEMTEIVKQLSQLSSELDGLSCEVMRRSRIALQLAAKVEVVRRKAAKNAGEGRKVR